MIRVAKSLIKQGDKYLLLKRSADSKFFASLWDFPGGKIDPDENVSNAVIREAKEETGLDVKPLKIVSELNYNEKSFDINFKIFSIESFSGEVKLSKDHTDFKWIDKKEIKELELAPVVSLFFKNYFK